MLLISQQAFCDAHRTVRWEGRYVPDSEHFARYLHEVVRTRMQEDDESLDTAIRGLATTGMDPTFIEDFLGAVHTPKGWEIGEVLAECLLRNGKDGQAVWPWNTDSDRRTPRASLPGADLVGFLKTPDGVRLLIGEVKTSSERVSPPSVMLGKKGMPWQLEASAASLAIQRTLIKWLHVRCPSGEVRILYQEALKHYFSTRGRGIVLAGVLVRDTSPSEKDLAGRARALSSSLEPPMKAILTAWYLPTPIDEWPAVIADGGS